MKTVRTLTLIATLLFVWILPYRIVPASAQDEPPQAPPPAVIPDAQDNPDGQAGWEDELDHLKDRLLDIRPGGGDNLNQIAPLSGGTQPSWVTYPFSATMVSAGLSFTCALSNEGAVKCWGDTSRLGAGDIMNQLLPVDVVGLSEGIKSISSSHKHTCAVTTSGGVKCWGFNAHGELGDGTTQDRIAPVDVVGLSSGVVSVTAGGFHTCVLMESGAVKCWGANWHGQVGDGSLEERHTPVNVYGLINGIIDVKAGKYHTCALTANGETRCWGYNLYGEVGNGSTVQQSKPVDVIGATSGVKSISLGALHSCARMSTGEARCWGDNTYGQLGDGTLTMRLTAVKVSGLTSAKTLSAGGYFTCAMVTGGGVKCWGDDWAGQLGNNTTGFKKIPVDVVGLNEKAVSLETGDSHTCVTTPTGKVLCWGSNASGQLGDGTSALRPVPVNVIGLAIGVASIVSGGLHTCALTTSGGVKCWGNNQYGQLGVGSFTDTLGPVDVVGLTSGVKAVVAGGYHTCALTTQGTVKCWGYNYYGQLGDNSTSNAWSPVNVVGLTTKIVALAGGFTHNCALDSDGVVYCWGRNNRGQLGDGTRTSSLVAIRTHALSNYRIVGIAAGESHSCALTGTGGVRCWGENYDGQLGDGTNTRRLEPVGVSGLASGATGIAAGTYHSCAQMGDGKIKCWGGNYSGQLGDGTMTSRTIPVEVVSLGGAASQASAGVSQTCAVVGGAAQCWGDNSSGQLGNGSGVPSAIPVNVSGLQSGVVMVAAGATMGCAVTNTGSAKCWGSNSNGQVGDGSIPWRLLPGQVLALEPAVLSVNSTSGQPGSFFTIVGSKFIPNSTASLQVNSYAFSQTVSADDNGGFVLRVSTAQAGLGGYFISARSSLGANTGFWLKAGDPLRADQGAGPLFAIPAGIAYTHAIYLP